MSLMTLKQQFISPSNEFTPIPFWFWNDALTEEEIIMQIGGFAEKGVMGFVIHPRMGIPETIPYLSDLFMDLVDTAVREASRRGMTVFLYDEAMYPSGSAKGFVVEGNPEFASRGLKKAEFGCAEPVQLSVVLGPDDALISAQAVNLQEGRLSDPASTVILKPVNGSIAFDPPDAGNWSILLFIETYSKGTIRGVHVGEDDGEPNAPASADLLNPNATAKFIRITHERYYERLARYFGNTVQAVFTDEPDILGRKHIKGLMPWTGDFLDLFLAEGNRETDLPLLWLEAEQATAVRGRFRKAVRKRLAAAYYKPLADWCERHGVALTGHPAGSEDIGLLDHFHIPGQDVVWRWVAPEDGKALTGKHSTMAKCSSDAARHRGRRRNLNEFLGVCGRGNGWALTADDMKWYMDWLLVRGVNMLCPHAFYYSVDGPLRYKERPPDAGPNNIWWPHYKSFAEYMKRMSWLMTDSRNVTPVAVLCQEDWLPWKVVKPLYEQQIEFNYLEENLLHASCKLENGMVRIANQSYSVVVVENSGSWEEETLGALARFREGGGTVIVFSEVGSSGGALPFTQEIKTAEQIVEALEGCIRREVALHPPASDIRVSRVVKAGHSFIVLVNEGEQRYEGSVTVALSGYAEQWGAWNGDIRPADSQQTEAGLLIRVALERRQSIIYRIDPDAQPVRSEPHGAELAGGPLQTLPLIGGWHVQAPGFPAAPAGLGSWSLQQVLEHVSGTAVYSNTFALDDLAAGSQVLLDLGEVHEIAEVRINGQSAGVTMWSPHVIDIGPFVRRGNNELIVAVTNSLANRLDGASLPSGLIGPVKLTSSSVPLCSS